MFRPCLFTIIVGCPQNMAMENHHPKFVNGGFREAMPDYLRVLLGTNVVLNYWSLL